jgi:hypothetical protein
MIFALVALFGLASLVAGWPHQFGGRGSRVNILADFVTTGTATSPPLAILVIFGFVAFAVHRRDRLGTAALVVLLPLAGLMAVGSMGEALAASTPDVPRLVQFATGGFGVLAAILLLLLGVAALVERRRASG